MKSKTFRVTISFDENKEKDIIKTMEDLADKRQLGVVLSNLIRTAYDNNLKNGGLKNVPTSPLSAVRQRFFDKLIKEVQSQDKKIDSIYSMCEDLYGLARANKALGLEGKVDNLMLSQFVMQRQQSRLKEILGEDGAAHLYASDRLLNEREKADKVWEYIAEVYLEMISELKPLLFKEIEIPVSGTYIPPTIQKVEKEHDDNEVLPLTEKPKKVSEAPEDVNKIVPPTGSAAQMLLQMMKN